MNSPQSVAKQAYSRLGKHERTRIDAAAGAAVQFLKTHDANLRQVEQISMQSDMRGKVGDVRDVIIHTANGEIGISAKHRHRAVKHSRLSASIDFGLEWYERNCSENYWKAVKPIFERLAEAKSVGKLWRDLPDKAQIVYAPLIRAFIAEVRGASAPKLLQYMLGEYDFYKVVKENGNVRLESFNMRGTLKWGNKLPSPSRIVDLEQARENTAIVTFDKGWSLSFRLHNAESKIQPSVKFDINLVDTPQIANHLIHY